MEQYKILFESLPWESPLHGVKFKKYVIGQKQLRLVVYDKTFVEPDWCEKGHMGFVISGEFKIDFNGEIITYQSGDALSIPFGEKHKHKAIILSETATVFLVEDV